MTDQQQEEACQELALGEASGSQARIQPLMQSPCQSHLELCDTILGALSDSLVHPTMLGMVLDFSNNRLPPGSLPHALSTLSRIEDKSP